MLGKMLNSFCIISIDKYFMCEVWKLHHTQCQRNIRNLRNIMKKFLTWGGGNISTSANCTFKKKIKSYVKHSSNVGHASDFYRRFSNQIVTRYQIIFSHHLPYTYNSENTMLLLFYTRNTINEADDVPSDNIFKAFSRVTKALSSPYILWHYAIVWS